MKILEQRRLALGLIFDPAEHFRAYTASVGCLRVLPASPSIVVNSINRADRHVVRAAIEFQGILLTGDAPLVSQCQKAQVVAKFPWSAIVEGDPAPPVEEILRVVQPSPRKGTIFARTTPGGWRGMTDVGIFTVVEIENVGMLAFDSRASEWVFDCFIGATVRLSYPPAGQGTTIVCASYDLLSAGRCGNLVLRAARFGSEERAVMSQSTLKGPCGHPGEIRVAPPGPEQTTGMAIFGT